MATSSLRVDLKIRREQNTENFIAELQKFCKQYATENNTVIEFDTTKYPDGLRFGRWDELTQNQLAQLNA